MKKIYATLLLSTIFLAAFAQPKMQATLKAGTTPRTVDVFLKPSSTFSQKDEASTITLAIPSTVSPSPSMGSSGVTANGTGPVSGITGIQPNFLINNLGSTSREVVVSTQTINATSYYIYTFIFSGTAASNHDWVANTEQLALSIQFNGCTSNCNPSSELLASLANGGAQGNSYFYFQPNVFGDITNYPSPFYSNTQSGTIVNGGSSDGSALSYAALATPVSLPIKLSAFNAKVNGCSASLTWQTSEEVNAAFYGIERSENGKDFKEVGRETKLSPGKFYTYIDNSTSSGKLFYRLRLVDSDGKFSYSAVKEVNLSCGDKNKVSVYPTLTNGVVNVKLPAGLENAHIIILNSIGKEILTDHSKSLSRSFNLRAFSNGTYIIQVLDNGNKIENARIILQK